jgi:hypothetical protein
MRGIALVLLNPMMKLCRKDGGFSSSRLNSCTVGCNFCYVYVLTHSFIFLICKVCYFFKTLYSENEDIFLSDHFLTFETLEEMVTNIFDERAATLRLRLFELLEVDASEGSAADLRAVVSERLWSLSGSYAVDDEVGSRRLTRYILDEVGSRLVPSDRDEACGFQCGVVVNPATEEAYTVFWPVRDVAAHEVALTKGLPHPWARARSFSTALLPFDEEYGERDGENGCEAAALAAPAPDAAALAGVCTTLAAHGFTVDGICRVLGLISPAGEPLAGVPVVPVWSINASRALAVASGSAERELADLAAMFVLGQPLAWSRLVELLGGTGAAALRDAAAIRPVPSSAAAEFWEPLLSLTPVSGGLVVVATDFFSTSGLLSRLGAFQPVMYVGPDSAALAAAAPRSRPAAALLDLCAGCGVQGVLAAVTYAATVVCVDANPRAVRFARFNFALNGLPPLPRGDERGELELGGGGARRGAAAVVLGDVCDLDGIGAPALAAIRGRADVILANPPYIPSAGAGAGAGSQSQLEAFGDGGATGDRLTAAIVEQLPAYLHPHRGRVHLVANMANVEEEYADKVRAWWATGLRIMAAAPVAAAIATGAAAASFAVLHGKPWSADEYAALIMGAGPHSGASQYADGLQRAGVRSVANGFLFGQMFATAGGDGNDGGGSPLPPPPPPRGISVAANAVPSVSVRLLHDELWLAIARAGAEAEALQLTAATAAVDADAEACGTSAAGSSGPEVPLDVDRGEGGRLVGHPGMQPG